MTLVWVARRSDKCGDSVVKLEENLARVRGSFSWSVVPKYVVFAELETGGGGGDRGGQRRALGDAEGQRAKPWEKECLKTIVGIKDEFCR